MVDPHESRRRDDNSPAPEAGDVPEIIDGEVVDTTRDDPAPANQEITVAAADAATFQQFLEFQKFQEWQREHGGTSAADTPSRPWWKRALSLLRYKGVRRLLYCLAVLVLAFTAFNHFFGGGNSSDSARESHVPGNSNPAISPVQGVKPADPVKAVYGSIATNDPTTTCGEFTPQAAKEFADSVGATDCPTAVLQLHHQITGNPTAYANSVVYAFEFNPDAVTTSNGQAEVPACNILAQGGPHLGTFHLQQLPNRGWRIDGYQAPPAQCPPG